MKKSQAITYFVAICTRHRSEVRCLGCCLNIWAFARAVNRLGVLAPFRHVRRRHGVRLPLFRSEVTTFSSGRTLVLRFRDVPRWLLQAVRPDARVASVLQGALVVAERLPRSRQNQTVPATGTAPKRNPLGVRQELQVCSTGLFVPCSVQLIVSM